MKKSFNAGLRVKRSNVRGESLLRFVEAFRKDRLRGSLLLTWTSPWGSFSSVFRKRSKEWKRQKHEKTTRLYIYNIIHTRLEFPKASRPSSWTNASRDAYAFRRPSPAGLGKQKRLTKSVPQSEGLQIPNSHTIQTYHTSVTSQDSLAKILLNLSTSSYAQVLFVLVKLSIAV